MSHLATVAIKPQQVVHEESGVIYRQAESDDNDTIKSILSRNNMDSWVALSTEYEPNYFDANNLFGTTQTIIARDTGVKHSAVGVCSSVIMPVHINGEMERVGYLGNLRVESGFRHKISVLRNGFKSIQMLSEREQDIPYWFTSIAKENSSARRLLEANLKGMPSYHPLGEMLTLALPIQMGKIAMLVECAQKEDIPALAQFYNKQARSYQYSPVMTEQWLMDLDGENGLDLQDFWLLKEEGVIRACFALWDQRKFKQTVVRGYRFPLNILRKPYNLYAKLSGRVILPECGENIDYIFIAFLALDTSVQSKCKIIIREALLLIKMRGAKMGMLGLSIKSPLLQWLDKHPGQVYRTFIESVTWPGRSENKLDPMPVQPEIAIL